MNKKEGSQLYEKRVRVWFVDRSEALITARVAPAMFPDEVYDVGNARFINGYWRIYNRPSENETPCFRYFSTALAAAMSLAHGRFPDTGRMEAQ